jgi:hypothetical protein
MSLFVSTATGVAVGVGFSAFDAADAASSKYDTANNAVLTSSDALATGDLSGAADALNSMNGPTPDLSRVAKTAHIASSRVDDTYTAVSGANAARPTAAAAEATSVVSSRLGLRSLFNQRSTARSGRPFSLPPALGRKASTSPRFRGNAGRPLTPHNVRWLGDVVVVGGLRGVTGSRGSAWRQQLAGAWHLWPVGMIDDGCYRPAIWSRLEPPWL